MEKIKHLSLIVIFYLVSFGLSYALVLNLPVESLILKALIVTVLATTILFIFSTVFKNSSIYDAYWSVQPLVILPFFVNNLNPPTFLMLGLIYFWGIRLTLNWVRTFKSLKKEDWRYTHFKKQFPRLFPVINYFGIHLMPTLVVFMVMLPAMLYLSTVRSLSLLIIVGAFISLVGIMLETIADHQAHQFRKQFSGLVNNQGLWQYSRHPNYLGEIMMWFGVFVMLMGVDIGYYITVIGPLLNLMLFMFISIPLMEKRQLKNKPDYQTYIETVNPLLSSPKKAYFRQIFKLK